MLACVVSTLVSRRLHDNSIYTEPLSRKGLTVDPGEVAIEQTVGDLMCAPVTPVRETTPLSEIAARFLASPNNFLPVVDADNQLLGVVALQDLKEHLGQGSEFGIIAYDVMRPPPPCVTPNQRLFDILPLALNSELRNIPWSIRWGKSGSSARWRARKC